MGMAVKLKVCGMKEQDNIKSLLTEVNPDYVGLITYDRSPRYMLESLSDVEFIIGTKKVGVFVNAKVEEIQSAIKKYGLDVIQLHGGESPDFCKQFKEKNVEVVKVFSVLDELPVEKMSTYLDVVDYFLLDTKTPKHGGSGKKFDWSILDKYQFDIPFFLSGGIDLDDADVIKKLNMPQLFALDINSKFESAPGIKDINKVKKFKDRLV